MLFHAFWCIYTAKELNSHAKHDQSLKKWVGVFLCQIHSFGVRICFEKCFSSMALYDVIMDENTAILLFRELKINMRLTDCVLYLL